MGATIVSQLGKALADEKNIKIIKATNVKDGINVKEISKKIGIPASQLYYPVKKLLELDLIEVVKSEQIKNLQEYYYSSYNLNEHGSTLLNSDENEFDGISMSADWIVNHKDEFVKLFLYRMQMFLDSALTEMDKYQDDPTYFEKIKAGGIFSAMKLSQEAQKKLFKNIYKLMDKAEAEDQGTNKETFNFMVQKW
ncbi:winged helix-turn-helix domain-containing protein [Liquorilactobacillus hordei]|uniref:winged helix-turn-helix domain-containing protein n=2 Tax=Liquorilactobacillus hordei TaxID=468911 RepID=UPI001CBAB24A|nr:helix-turn-helix domain-containing protein [Liquorilactobacillus hordei]MBZ2405071.1 transcriptional regulator [Liquorilactobacillus hordei]